MLTVLLRAEQELPKYLSSLDGWNSLDVDYEPPRVERLWRPFEDYYRLYLHRIHPCANPLYHPHPWPSAIRIISGEQMVRIGTHDQYGLACCIMTAGTCYEMSNPFGWHSVEPLGEPSLSVMVTSRPWEGTNYGIRPTTPLQPLSDSVCADLLQEFRLAFGG